MGFWSTQPVSALGTSGSEILPLDALLEKTETELQASKLKLEYEVLTDLNEEQRKPLLEFINTYYLVLPEGQVIYGDAILEYYLRTSILLRFFKKPTDTLGIIVGNKKHFHLFDKDIWTIEVNFFTLHPKLRTLHIAPYMIGALTKECILRFKEVHSAFYTVGEKILSPKFGTKDFYHRPINMPTLMKSGFVPYTEDLAKLRRKYNWFDKVLEPNYIRGANPEMAVVLATKLEAYCKKTYSIFDIKTAEELNNIFSSPVFHTFVFDDEFIILYCLENMANGVRYTNGMLYITAVEPERAERIIDSVAAYCQKHKIADILSFTDVFPNSLSTCVQGSGSLHYYAFNMNMNKIENSKNGLVTI